MKSSSLLGTVPIPTVRIISIAHFAVGILLAREGNWICESVGKLKGIRKQGEVKMNEINVHAIADFQRYVQSYGLPKLPIHGLRQIYKHALVALPCKPTPSTKDHRKSRNPYLSRYGERWVEKLNSSSSMSKF